jgi:hypothetical protein
MAEFRKIPEIVDAVQWNKPGDHPKVYEFVMEFGSDHLIDTDKGMMGVRVGDWIVTDATGISLPIKGAVFHQLYQSTRELTETDKLQLNLDMKSHLIDMASERIKELESKVESLTKDISDLLDSQDSIVALLNTLNLVKMES